MTDDEIRAALLAARGFAPRSEPNHVIVARSRVEGDLSEIDAWVRTHGGRMETQPGYESQAMGQGRWQRGPTTEPSHWYVIPAAALGI
ncbi:MAG: hypothetical protein ACLGI5_10405 [Thermoleophilia bacterium]